MNRFFPIRKSFAKRITHFEIPESILSAVYDFGSLCHSRENSEFEVPKLQNELMVGKVLTLIVL